MILENLYIHIFLLFLVVITSVFAVSHFRIIRGAILLGAVSFLISIILFMLKAPIAAMFELSVCAGLITVIFISVISITNPPYIDQRKQNRISMWKKIIALLSIILICGICIYLLDEKNIAFIPVMQSASASLTTKDSLWNMRHVDLIGQALILLTGIFAVVVLFKKGKDEK